MTHPAGIVKSVGVDASVGFLLSTVKCVALLTHSLGIMQGVLVRTLVYSPLLTASIRLVLNHIWQSIRCASLFLGSQISIFPSNTILYLRFLIDSLLYSSLIAPWNEPLIYLKVEHRPHVILKWNLYLLVQNFFLLQDQIQTFLYYWILVVHLCYNLFVYL